MFIDALREILELFTTRYNIYKIVVSGDINIDLLKADGDDKINSLIDMMSSYGFLLTITKPTRITEHSATLI